MQAILKDQLSQLKLGGLAQALMHQQEQAHLYLDMSFEQRLTSLLEHELTVRQQRRIDRLIKQAKFRLQAQVEQIEYTEHRGFTQASIRNLIDGHWLTHNQNLIITGATGCGKSYLACALGQYLCRQSQSVRYFRLKSLLEALRQAQVEGTYPRLLGQLQQVTLLIIDDWGMEALDNEQRSNLLDIIDGRYQQQSTLIVSQIPVENWYQIIGESTFADAILDRLIHHSLRLELKGESMRKTKGKLTDADQLS